MLVPVDIALTVVGRRSQQNQQTYDDASHSLIALYSSVYIPMLFLSSMILTIQEGYYQSGYFTEGSRVINSIKDIM